MSEEINTSKSSNVDENMLNNDEKTRMDEEMIVDKLSDQEIKNEMDLYADHEIKEEIVIGPEQFLPYICNLDCSKDAPSPKMPKLETHEIAQSTQQNDNEELTNIVLNSTTSLEVESKRKGTTMKQTESCMPHNNIKNTNKNNTEEVRTNTCDNNDCTIRNCNSLNSHIRLIINPVNETQQILSNNANTSILPNIRNLSAPLPRLESVTIINNNIQNDPGLWRELSKEDIRFWLTHGPSDCQNANGPFEKSSRRKGPCRSCNKSIFFGKKSNGECRMREWLLFSPSRQALFCFMCLLYSRQTTNILVKGYNDWHNMTNSVKVHEKSTEHRISLLKYLTYRQDLDLPQAPQNLKQIQGKCVHWELVLQRVVEVMVTLAESYRGRTEPVESPYYGGFFGLLEVISPFDPLLAAHITNSEKGSCSYLSKALCEKLITFLAQRVSQEIIKEVQDSGYFSICIDSAAELTHANQLHIAIRYTKDGEPKERFLTSIELKANHTDDELANQILLNLQEVCGLDLSKCRGQSYDNASNMSGRYNVIQKNMLELNPFAIQAPCAAHCFSVIGRSAVDFCPSAVSFFSTIKKLGSFFSTSTNSCQMLKNRIENENDLKYLSDTRWESYYKATAVISGSFDKILDTLETISVDDMQRGEVRTEAETLANELYTFEFVFLLIMWDEILQCFRKHDDMLQKEDVTLQTRADICTSLYRILLKLREEFHRLEDQARAFLPNVDYTITRLRRQDIDCDHPYSKDKRSPRDTFHANFITVIDKLIEEIHSRRNNYEDISKKFSLLTTTAADLNTYNMQSEILVHLYHKDLDSGLAIELQQFHSYVKQKQKPLSHLQLYQIMQNDKLESAFPNVDIALRIFLCMFASHCAASFSKLKLFNRENGLGKGPERLDALSLLYMESDLLKAINLGVIREFSRTSHSLLKNK